MPDKQLNDSILKIAKGVNHFQKEIYKEKETLFHSLAKKQQPKILFITCSDSRIDPSLITQTEPGDMFLITNAGNIIPPQGSAYGGTGASIEYAVSVLQVEHIIVCGHSSCGAMNALMQMETLEDLPAVKRWLSYAEATRAILKSHETTGMSHDEKLDYCITMNIPVQLSHLKTLPSVAAKLVEGKVTLHGWIYDIASGNINVYNEESKSVIPFSEAYPIQNELKASV